VTTDVDLDEQGESLWRAVTEAWDDQPRHDRFVQHCFSVGRLPAAAACYRKVLQAHADNPTVPTETTVPASATAATAAIARRMQERVVFLSMSSLVPSSRDPNGSRLMNSPWLVAIILFGAAVGAVLGFVFGARP
jgi:hypothetical protein